MTKLPDAIAISETKLNSTSSSNIDILNYHFFHNDSPSMAGGVGIYLKNTLSFVRVTTFLSKLLIVRISGSKLKVKLVILKKNFPYFKISSIFNCMILKHIVRITLFMGILILALY